MEWLEVLKLYGPSALPWIAFGYLGKWHLDRLDRDLEARIKMATVLEGILKVVEKLDAKD